MWNTFYYGVCYYPEHWEERRHPADIQRIAEAGFNLVRIGEGAWAYWEPEEGQFQFDMFDRVIDLCRKHDVKVIMGTPTYAAPAWVATRYPEVLRWNFNRIPMKHGSRRNLNYTSPKYLELSDKLCTALADHYRDEKQIIGWQLDNEFNCHMDVSYAPSDTVAFREWLKAKYRTLDRLNDAWGTRFWSQTYSDWEQVDLPHPTATYLNPSALLDESRFISDCVVRFARRQASILRARNDDWHITHNALFSNVNGPNLVSVLDFFSHDQYPGFCSSWPDAATSLVQARSLSFPYAVLEQQSGPGGQMQYLHPTPRPGMMRLLAWQSIIHGAKLLSYFRWRTCPYGSEQHWHGILDPDDRDNRRLAEAAQLGQEAKRLPLEFLDAPVARGVAVLRDFDNDVNESRINTYTGNGRGEAARWLHELSRRHIPADIVWPESDFEGYRLLVAPHIKIVSKALAAKLMAFVDAGGALLVAAQSGSKDLNCHLVESSMPGVLRRLCGVEVEDWTTLPPGETRDARLADGELVTLTNFVERLKTRGGETIARWMTEDTLLAGAPAIVRNWVGKGDVYYVGGYAQSAGISELLDFLTDELEIEELADCSTEVEVIERVAGRKRWLALLNHSNVTQRVRGLPFGKDMLTKTSTRQGHYVLPPLGVAIIEALEERPRKK